VVFSDPEIAAVALTEAQARQPGVGHEVATATVSLPDAISRPWTYERDPRGELGLVLRSSKAVHELAAEVAGRWRWSSPDPGFGVGVELSGGGLYRVGDLSGVCKGLSGERCPA
jgi:hypothetical protein